MNTADDSPRRTWSEVKNGKVRGMFSFTDAEMLVRLERGEQWVPFTATMLRGRANGGGRLAAMRELCETIAAEVADEAGAA